VLDEVRDERTPTILDADGLGARHYARELRLTLAREHLDHADESDLLDPVSAFRAFASRAQELQTWHDTGRTGPRPPGRVRPYTMSRMPRRTLAWATPLYRVIYDPDGRPLAKRYRHRF
jgi:hypothetical protein